jgi:hypothetical protein
MARSGGGDAGSLLNPRGRAVGTSERSLFTGSEDRAMRYASQELLNYWQEHPRPTAADSRPPDNSATAAKVTVTVVRRRKAA